MKNLICLLTSNGLNFLKESVNCVYNQKDITHNYTLLIVVNTLNDEYYESVKKEFPDVNVVRTESNGRPGKGHNSLQSIFEQQEQFEYLIQVDGDDFLYPYAINRLEEYMKNGADICVIPFNDTLANDYPEHVLSYPIADRCYLKYNNFIKDLNNLWLTQKQCALKQNVNLCDTTGRIIFYSKFWILI